MIAGTTLAAIPCLFLSALPCIISGKTLENSKQGDKDVKSLYLKIHFLSILFPKHTKNLRPSAGSQLVRALFEVLF
jgi:hypothetical protein